MTVADVTRIEMRKRMGMQDDGDWLISVGTHWKCPIMDKSGSGYNKQWVMVAEGTTTKPDVTRMMNLK